MKNRGRSHKLPQDPTGIADEGKTEKEVMFDDQINSRPIETVDVDPFNYGNVYMPVVEERREQDQFGGVENVAILGIPDRQLEEELEEMERDLEKEVEEKVFREQSAHQNREVSDGSSLRFSGAIWLLTISLLFQLYDGHG